MRAHDRVVSHAADRPQTMLRRAAAEPTSVGRRGEAPSSGGPARPTPRPARRDPRARSPWLALGGGTAKQPHAGGAHGSRVGTFRPIRRIADGPSGWVGTAHAVGFPGGN